MGNLKKSAKKVKRAVEKSSSKVNDFIHQGVKQKQSELIKMDLTFEDTIENHLTLMLLQKKRNLRYGQ